MDIIEMKLNDLHPYENNPRYNDDAVEAVASSIKQFGFKVPIIIDKNNVIVTGHTRYKASKKLGLKKVPCIRADDLTEDQVKAFRLADNKVGELASWDMEKLGVELDGIEMEMEDFGFDLSDYDFSMDDLNESDGYDEKNDDREYFEKTFTFPIEKKNQIVCYLKKHQNEIVEKIIRESEKEK
jgi:ParB-like chromosome segregation protein Spo0J